MDYSGSGAFVVSFLITLVVVLLIILVCRGIVCWYFKINKAINLLEEQNEILKDIRNRLK